MPSTTSKQQQQQGGDSDVRKDSEKLLFGINERPPWYLWLLLSFQQFLMSVTSSIPNPLIIAVPLCLIDDVVGVGELLGTVFFVGGVSSLLQTTFGTRLPIIQGPSSSFIAPITMLLKTKSEKCPVFNQTGDTWLPFEPGSDDHKALWHSRLAELQGALLIAALVEVIIGMSGLIGVLMKYIGPITTGTVLTLIGLSLTPVASSKGSTQWWLCFVTAFLIILFSQYLRNITMPFLGERLKIFLLFPVLLGIGLTWFICMILTETGALPDKKGEWGYEARTDIKLDAITEAEWFRFPYPGQWGTPTISAGGVIAMIAAILASTIESVGDYHACARLCSVPTPPGSAISRGIGMEGICCVLAGAWGSGSGFTSYSHNIASIGLTKVGSRVVVQLAAVMLIVVGCVGKFGAFFSTIPDPIIGGMVFAMFGMVTAVGIANLQLVDLNSTRNQFIFGFSMFFGISVPSWVAQNPFTLGNETANQVLTVFCSTSMLIGGAVAFVLDNTVPGTLEERGILAMEQESEGSTQTDESAYDLPLIQNCLDKIRCLKYIPFCPGFIKDKVKPKHNLDDDEDDVELDDIKVKAGNGLNGGIANGGFTD